MAGPSIAKAEVTVDLDGKRLPAQAKALGEEAGREYSDAFNEETEKGYGDLRKATEEDLRRTGQLAGDGSGDEFSKAFRAQIQHGAQDANDDLARIFGATKFGGLDGLNKELGETDSALGGVERTVDHVNGLLQQAYENGGLNEFQFKQLFGETEKWAESARGAARALDGINGAKLLIAEASAKDFADETERVHDALKQVNEDRLNGVLNDLETAARDAETASAHTEELKKSLHDVNEERLTSVLNDLRDARDESDRWRGQIDGLSGDVDELAKDHVRKLGQDLADAFDDTGGLEGYRSRLHGLGGEFATVEEVVTHVSSKLDAFERAGGTSGEHTDILRGKLETFAKTAGGDVVSEVEKAARGLDRLGDAAERNGRKTGGLKDAIGKLAGSLRGFDPTDNPLQLFLIILAAAGPLAVGVGALAGQILVLGTFATAALVGVGGLALAFKGMSGPIDKLPASVQPAAKAFQDLSGHLEVVNGRTVRVGGVFSDLQRTLQEATFKDMAKPFTALGNALKDLGPGVTAVGGALNGFLKNVSGSVTSNVGPINDLLKGFAPIIGKAGDAVVSLAGVFGGLLKAATPFAKTFADDLANSAKKLSDLVNSVKGQKALTSFFADAKEPMDALGRVVGSLGKAFSILITPETKADFVTITDDIGKLVVNLSKVGAALSPAVTALVDVATDAIDFVAKLTPIVSGIGAVAKGVEAVIKPILDFLGKTLAPGFEAVGAQLDILGKATQTYGGLIDSFFKGFSAGLAPAVKDLKDFVGQMKDFFEGILKGAKPQIDALGKAFESYGKAIGGIVSALVDVGKKLFGFGDEAQKAGVKLGAQGLSGILKFVTDRMTDFTGYLTNDLIPAIKEIDVEKVKQGFKDMADAIPAIIDAFKTFASAIGIIIGVIGDFVGAGVAGAKTVGDAFVGMAKVANDVAHNNFAAAIVDIGKSFATTKADADDFAAKSGKALRDTGSAFDQLGKDGKRFQGDIDTVVTAGKKALGDFESAGKGNLSGVSKSLGLTGDASTKFRELIAGEASKAGVSLETLAKAKSLPDLEKALGVTGNASKTDFANKIIAAMAESGVSIDKLPPKIKELVDKYGTLPPEKNTNVTEKGAAAAKGALDLLKGSIDALKDKTVTITNNVLYKTANGSGYVATGGVLMDGILVAGGRRFAAGGLLSHPAYIGNNLVAEAGAEAIVPLSRPLNQVDPSVRNLAAYAQGLAATTNKDKGGSYVAAGAIVIQTPAADPTVVATQVVDRLVPIL